MFYLPRICEHCLNPSCVASCPSGAMYKRAEDGIVLVDQDRCRGWRMCVTGCPYKKMYFNHKTGKAEKCTFCYPRDRGRAADGLLGDLRGAAALHRRDALRRRPGARGGVGARTTRDLYPAQLGVFLDPHDPEVIARRRAGGHPDEWMEAARRSPVYELIATYRVALPLHPEYRTMPMVWYIPPLSPVVEAVSRRPGTTGRTTGTCSAPSRRCASRSSTWPSCSPRVTPAPVERRAAAAGRDARLHARHQPGPRNPPHIPHAVGMTEEQMDDMYRLLAIAKYEDRYVIPTAMRRAACRGAGRRDGVLLSTRAARAWTFRSVR